MNDSSYSPRKHMRYMILMNLIFCMVIHLILLDDFPFLKIVTIRIFRLHFNEVFVNIFAVV